MTLALVGARSVAELCPARYTVLKVASETQVKIPSLKKIKVADLNLIFVGSIRKWANAQHETVHLDLATAAADELERRGRPVPFDEVRAETQLMFATAIAGAEELQTRFGK